MLKVGDGIPDITLSDHDGNAVSLKDYSGKQSIVVYFYPKNETPGCIVEACSFRDHYEEFKELGAEVIGISGDSVRSHQNVKNKRKLPFVMLSDRKRLAESAFGVPRNLFGLLPGRVTFVINKEGKVIHRFNSSTNPSRHITESLEILRNQS